MGKSYDCLNASEVNAKDVGKIDEYQTVINTRGHFTIVD